MVFGRLRLIGATAVAAAGAVYATTRPQEPVRRVSIGPLPKLPSREQQLEQLDTEEFDVVVIGGGATGCGVALDATTRGLKVALLEREDYAAGTSSRSTKLIHGGVRYLEKAFKELDREQLDLVVEALRERETLLRIAPHVADELPIMVALYKWWEVPYMYVGLKMYDLLAWYFRRPTDPGVSGTKLFNRRETIDAFPQINADGLKASLIYHDGQHDDAAMTLAVAMTAAERGALTINHVAVNNITKDEAGQVNGVVATDSETGRVVNVRAKAVVNATGCFTDAILQMDDPKQQELVVPSQGLHIILPAHFCPPTLGMLQPSTSDGRVLFFLPWQGRVVAGTTDSAVSVTDRPSPNQPDVDFVLRELRSQLSPDIKLGDEDVLAAWTGIRPLVRNPRAKGTKDIPRTHFVDIAPSGLVTIAGGKWTTYRQMAEDTMDETLKAHKHVVAPKPSSTCNTMLYGGDGYAPSLPIVLMQKFHLPQDIASHLAHRYGDRAYHVIECAPESATSRLTPSFPYTDNDVTYATRHEQARTVTDVVARRTRLAFLDHDACVAAIDRVADIMSKELGWTDDQKNGQIKDAQEFLTTMHMPKQIA